MTDEINKDEAIKVLPHNYNAEFEENHRQDPLSTNTMSISRSDLGKDLDLSNGKTLPKSDESLNLQQLETLKIICHHCSQKLDVTYMAPFTQFECPSCKSDLIVPKWFGNFLLEEKVGIGGMAEVHRALDIVLDREVAIKILNPELYAQDHSRELFLNEARMAANINNHAVVPIFTCGILDDSAYIVMQYMNGNSLEDIIHNEGENVDLLRAVKWMKDIAEGLDSANKANIVHHDIKPGNIMLDSDDKAKICDFGLSQSAGDMVQAISRGWVSPHYVSPEKVMTGIEDFRGDIYSLGATFYHVLTGKTPFIGNDINEIMQARLNVHPTAPNLLRPEIPKVISDLILMMLNSDPNYRPSYEYIVETLLEYILKTMRRKKTAQKKMLAANSNAPKSKVVDEYIQNRKKNTMINKLLVLTIVLAVVLLGFFVLVSQVSESSPLNSYLAPVKDALGIDSVPKDYLPEASKAFADGDVDRVIKLTSNFLAKGTTDIDALKQVMVQNALAQYLNNSKYAPETAANFVKTLKSFKQEGDLLFKILLYLSDDNFSAKQQTKLLSTTKYMSALAANAIFIKSLYTNQPATTLSATFTIAQKQSKKIGQSGFWGIAWLKRYSHWYNSLLTANYSDIEPVFLSKTLISTEELIKVSAMESDESSKVNEVVEGVKGVESNQSNMQFVTLDTDKTNADEAKRDNNVAFQELESEVEEGPVKADIIKKAHAMLAKKRIVPKKYDFTSKKIEQYLKKLKSKVRTQEQIRISLLKPLKFYLPAALQREPYVTRELKLSDGKTIEVSTMKMGDDGSFIVTQKSGKLKVVPIAYLCTKDYINLVAFIADKKAKDTVSDLSIKKKLSQSIAMDYLRTAILCDWYKDYEGAAKYANKALKTSSSVSKAVTELFTINPYNE